MPLEPLRNISCYQCYIIVISIMLPVTILVILFTTSKLSVLMAFTSVGCNAANRGTICSASSLKWWVLVISGGCYQC